MPMPIVYIDTSTIREGKHETLKAAMTHLAAFVAVHPDSASLQFHMDEAGGEFRRFAELIELTKIEVYGQVSEAVLERLHRKARLLGNGTVIVHDLYAGFGR